MLNVVDGSSCHCMEMALVHFLDVIALKDHGFNGLELPGISSW